MYPLTRSLCGHEIIEMNESALRVNKHHHTYYLEGEAARRWKRSCAIASDNDILGPFLDKLMVTLGQMPV